MPERSSEDNDDDIDDDNDDDMSRDLSGPNSVKTLNGNNCMPPSNENNALHGSSQSATQIPIAPNTPNNLSNMSTALSLAQNMPSTNISPTSSALAHLPGSLQHMGLMQNPVGHPMMMEWQHQMFQQQNYLGAKLEEPFEFKPYHYDPYCQQQFATATQYPNICQPPQNFEY